MQEARSKTETDDVAMDYTAHLIRCAESIVAAREILELKFRVIRAQLK